MKILKIIALFIVCATVTVFICEAVLLHNENEDTEFFGAEAPKKTQDYRGFASGEPLLSRESIDISAKSAILCTDDGLLIYEKHADVPLPMASITKIMSCIVALEICNDISEKYTVPKEAVGIEGSSVYLAEGEKVSIEMLLYSTMLESANDAVTALAILVKGSQKEFVDLMNKKAEQLSMTSTHFENPHGLHSDHHFTTARDFAILTAYALKNESFRQIISTKKIYYPSSDGQMTRVLVNHNKLLSSYNGIIGGKTGYTKTSGRTLVNTAQKNGTTLICVTLNAPDDWQDHTDLLDIGFKTVKTDIFKKETEMQQIGISCGQSSYLKLALSEDVSLSHPLDEKVRVEYRLPHYTFATVRKGQRIGSAEFYIGDKKIRTADLVAMQTVQKIEYKKNILEKIMDHYR